MFSVEDFQYIIDFDTADVLTSKARAMPANLWFSVEFEIHQFYRYYMPLTQTSHVIDRSSQFD